MVLSYDKYSIAFFHKADLKDRLFNEEVSGYLGILTDSKTGSNFLRSGQTYSVTELCFKLVLYRQLTSQALYHQAGQVWLSLGLP